MKVIEIWHKMKEFPIIGMPYQKLIGNRKIKTIHEKQREYIKHHGLTIIEIVESVLNNNNLLYFADMGTLLGALRDHSFIEWDPDIDYGFVMKDGFSWEILQKEMEKNGFKKVREWRAGNLITEHTYQIGDATIDIWAHFKTSKGMSYYYYRQLPNNSYKNNQYSVFEFNTPAITDVRKEKLQSFLITVPSNAEDILLEIYNDDWRIPNPNYDNLSGKGCKLREDIAGFLYGGIEG